MVIKRYLALQNCKLRVQGVMRINGVTLAKVSYLLSSFFALRPKAILVGGVLSIKSLAACEHC